MYNIKNKKKKSINRQTLVRTYDNIHILAAAIAKKYLLIYFSHTETKATIQPTERQTFRF